MKKALRLVAASALSSKKVTDEQISRKLSEELNQWFLNVATDNHKQKGLDKISPEMRANMRKHGVELPYADAEEDAFYEEGEDEDFDWDL
eukprot:gene7942-1416_t